MHKLSRAVLLSLVVVLVFMATAASSLANRAIAVEGAEGGITAEGVLVIGEPELLNTISCNVTWLGTIKNVIAKTRGAEFGRITGVAIDIPRCRHAASIENVEQVIPLRAPRTPECRELGAGIRLCITRGEGWNLTYETFSGLLPQITAMLFRLEGIQFLVEYKAITIRNACLYEGSLGAQANINEAGMAREWFILLPATRFRVAIRLAGLICGEPQTASGTFRLRPELRIRLS